MKMTKKKVFVAALAICIVAILSLSTLAWFSDSDDAENKFMVADSDAKPDDVFSVDVTEFVANDGETTEQTVDKGYTFEDIVPGDVVTKRPFVTNKCEYDQYIRVTVTISDYKAFNDALGDEYDVANVFKGVNSQQLELASADYGAGADGDEIVFVYYVNEIVSPAESIMLFTHVEIPSELTQYHFANATLSDEVTPNTLKDGFTIDIFAEAVQADNTVVNAADVNSAAAAIEAFATVEADQTI